MYIEKRFSLLRLTFLLLTIALYLICCQRCAPPSGEVDIIEKVYLNGMEQWIMANAASVDLPVLLWLHGGPDAAQMPAARYFYSYLEGEFIVVHWDQRGRQIKSCGL